MAIYHFSVNVISRSSGSSATAAAAYRAGEKIMDERTGEIHDYTRKTGVDSSWILAPESAPDWVFNREKLWNEVESVERRRDSQLAREINVALPTELDMSQQLELVREFVNEQFIDEGMVADIACHDLDTHNPHAHIMLTMREIDEQGFSAKKNRDWNKKELLEKQRLAWATHANKALEMAGVNQTIDHRSLEAQGAKHIPQIHLGVAVNAMRKRGIITEREEQYLEIEAANREIRKSKFHLGLLDRLESIYKNNPELDPKLGATTDNQKQSIKPVQIEQPMNSYNSTIDPPKTAQKQEGEQNTESKEQSRESDHTKEPERLDLENAHFVEKMARITEDAARLAQKMKQDNINFAENLERIKKGKADLNKKLDALDEIPNQPKRHPEDREDRLKAKLTEPELPAETSRANPKPEGQSDKEKILDLSHDEERTQVLKIACELMRQPNLDTWNKEPDSRNYNLTSQKKLFIVEAKDGRGEILRFQNGKITAQKFTEKDLKMLHRAYASKYQDFIAHTAERFLHLTGRKTWNNDNGSVNYNFMTDKEGLLVIEAKDGRGEILRRKNGKVTARGLNLKDVKNFMDISTGLDQKLEQARSKQRNRSRGYGR